MKSSLKKRENNFYHLGALLKLRVVFYLIIIAILVLVLIGWRDRAKQRKKRAAAQAQAKEVVCQGKAAIKKSKNWIKVQKKTINKKVCQVNKVFE